MKYAIVNNERVEPTPKAKGVCPGCGAEVIAKCGSVNVWHWAHLSADCDPWYEPEGEWHRSIKNWFQPEHQEVVLQNHRADVWTGDDNPIIELQNSPISSEEIIERENFYKQYIKNYPYTLVWIINGEEFEHNFFTRNKGNFHTYRWYHYRKTWSASNSMVIIHFPKKDTFFHIKKSYSDMRNGWGVFITKNDILRMAYCASI